MTRPRSPLGAAAVPTKSTWVQTERKAHEAWASLIARKPRSAQLLHHLVARMAHQNAVVVSQKTLAKIMGCSLRTTQYAIATLVDENWIQLVKLNGPGTVSAYVVNDRVAWGQARHEISALSTFSATVIADSGDQDAASISGPQLRRIPMLFQGEHQLPHGPGESPPSQPAFEGMEPDLPTRRDPHTVDMLTGKADNEG